MDHTQVYALGVYVSRLLLPSGSGAKARAAVLCLCSAEASSSGCQSVHSICLGGGQGTEQQLLLLLLLLLLELLRAAEGCPPLLLSVSPLLSTSRPVGSG